MTPSQIYLGWRFSLSASWGRDEALCGIKAEIKNSGTYQQHPFIYVLICRYQQNRDSLSFGIVGQEWLFPPV